MPSSSSWATLRAPVDSAGITDAPSTAPNYAPYASAHERAQTQRLLQTLTADARAGQERVRLPEAGTLPDGYLPIREARHLALLGRWPLLDDKAPACLPLKVLLSMRRRCELGDPDADAWLKTYARAYAGVVEAQYTFGRVCENGIFRAPADCQRAFFWYHRAALEGHVEARMATERLMRETRISPAAMAEPILVYPGPWRIAVDMPGRPPSRSLFELDENGAASGHRIGGAGIAAEMISNALSTFAASFTLSLFSPVMRNVEYSGRWAYDNTRKVLTLTFAASAAGMPGSRSDTWQIELLGCRVGAIFGRDHRNFSYTLEHGAPEGAKCATAEREQ
jgi:hypothetical protein